VSIHLFSGKQGYKTNEKAALLANVSDLHLVHADLDLDPYPAKISMWIRNQIQGANRMQIRADLDPGISVTKFW
jgi:hypothetical protein